MATTARLRPRTRPALAAAARLLVLVALGAAAMPRPADAQEARIRDLVSIERDVPVRLMGYGLVVGLDGTGDRAMGSRGSPHTVRSVTNLLSRFGIQVPAELMRTRNVAAVLVTAEISPYLRPGGRFEVNVASVGDALSLRGGQLWSTPLLTGPGASPVASAQGSIALAEGTAVRGQYRIETSGTVPAGGLIEAAVAAPGGFQGPVRLLLRSPDLGTAVRMAEVVNAEYGQAATVEDPGSILLEPPAGTPMPVFLQELSALTLEPGREARIVIDARDGTVVASGGLTVGEAVVSHGTLTVAIGGTVEEDLPGSVRVPAGTSVQDVATALHAVAATPDAIAAIFRSLREVGAIRAALVVR